MMVAYQSFTPATRAQAVGRILLRMAVVLGGLWAVAYAIT
jgi:hypothetical protein